MRKDGRVCGDVLVIPVPQAGHVNSIMIIVKFLIERGISVTVVISENRQELVRKYSEEGGEGGSLLNVQLVVTDSLVDSYAGVLKTNPIVESACAPFFQRIVSEQECGGQTPKCIIADQFLGPLTQRLSTKLKIARYVGISSPACYGYFISKFSSLIANGLLDCPEVDQMIDLPGVSSLHLRDISKVGWQNPRFLSENGDTLGEAELILVNTFDFLESPQIEAFQAQLTANTSPERKAPIVLSIGPLLPSELFRDDRLEDRADSECIQWLNTRPPSSVVYIALGSMAFLSPDEIQELSYGLEASHQSFLWILRTQAKGGVTELLPEGFQTRTKDQGLIFTEFAPQLQILSHPAIGGFLTHCGWNSSLESICRGVPMIGWPMRAEQPLCCRILVEQAKVAVEIKTRGHNTVDRKSLEKAIRLLMTESEGKELRKSALELQRQARASVSQDGSSHANFETLIAHIKSRIGTTFSNEVS